MYLISIFYYTSNKKYNKTPRCKKLYKSHHLNPYSVAYILLFI